MAAKKKSNSAKEEENKSKAKLATKKRGRPKKKPEAPQKEELKVTDDDFGLDDISLDEEVYLDEQVDELEPLEEQVPAPEGSEDEPLVVTAVDIPEERMAEKVLGEDPVKHTEEEEKKGGLIWLLVALAIIVIAVLLYFFVFDKDEPQPEPMKKEQPKPQPKPEPEPEPVPEPEPEPVVTAELYTISAPDGRFYVVVGSFYDVDLAEDKAKEIVAGGESAYVLKPSGDFPYHRVGVAANSTMAGADSAREGLKAQFGEDIWVVKY